MAYAGAIPLPQPTVWESATPVIADGWLQVDINYQIVRNRLVLCKGAIISAQNGEMECHKPGTTYTKPTFFTGGQTIPGQVTEFLTPQQYLDEVAARHPLWHQKLTFSAMAVSHSNYGGAALWIFYRVSAARPVDQP